jgi:hypothetical protein
MTPKELPETSGNAGTDSRKPWSTPLVILSDMEGTANNNNGANTDVFTSGIFFGSFS